MKWKYKFVVDLSLNRRHSDFVQKLTVNGYESLSVTIGNFADSGELKIRIDGVSVPMLEGSDIALIVQLESAGDAVSLYSLIDSLVRDYHVNSIQVAIPYFVSARAERVANPGEVPVGRAIASMLANVAQPPGKVTYYVLDAHSDTIIDVLGSGGSIVRHLYAQPLLIDSILTKIRLIRRNSPADFVLASPDTGRLRWVESYANELNSHGYFVGPGDKITTAYCHKTRGSDGNIASMELHGDVDGKIVFLFDDLTGTGGTLLEAAATMHIHGALRVIVVVTHGLFALGSAQRIIEAGVEVIICTNSHSGTMQYDVVELAVNSKIDILFIGEYTAEQML